MRQIKIDWAALHSAFQSSMPEVRCFLSLEDGQVLKMLPGDPNLAVVRCQPLRYVPIEAIPSRIQYQWLDEFIKTLDDGDTRTRIQAAANGKGAFRRFKDILLTMPEERRRWFEFRDQKMRLRIVEWVREQGIEPTNEPPWVSEARATVTPITTTVHLDVDSDNDPGDLTALRDFLSWWKGRREALQALSEAELEDLTLEMGKRFRFTTLPNANLS